MTETEGEKKNQEGKRTENRRKEKRQNMKNTHLLGGCSSGGDFTIKLGNFEILEPNLPTRRGFSPSFVCNAKD